jgi:predicted nucleic acid-binding protein
LATPYEGSLRLGSRQAQQGLLIFPNTSINISMKKPESVTVVVADTSGLMSLLVDTDANHHKALAQSQVFDESLGAVIIPSHVFSELMNVLGKKLGHKVAVSAGQQILTTPQYLIVESDKELEETLERFARQPSSVSFIQQFAITLDHVAS